jgi:CDP-diglyceride synthetase
MRSDYLETTQTRNTMAKLGYMGLIPFLFGLLLSLTDSQFFSLSGETLFITYSVVILSFLSGILWGNAIENFESQSSNKALILSNVIVLAAWLAVLLGEQQEFLTTLILILGYIAVWRAERSMREENQSEGPDGYFDMRTRLTSSVVLMHGIVMLT